MGFLRRCKLNTSTYIMTFHGFLISNFTLRSISTANNLAWSVRMALKRMDLGANLSVIDPSKLDPKAIYYVPPFYESLKMKRCFERGYFGYRGTHEHLSVISHVALSDLHN